MIKNIIFDLGAVLLNIDFEKTISAFKKLGATNIDEIFSANYQKDFLDSFEKGFISPEQLRKKINEYLKIKNSDTIIDEAKQY